METPLLFSLCSLLMASLFALSVSMQFNDPDWYFWLPLYAIACAVNLVNGVFTHKITKQVPKSGLWLGIFLFIKVVLEDLLHGISGFWSLNLRDRVVREKFGSGLVITCMFLHLQASSKTKAANYVLYGMVVLVGISYGLSFVFFVFQQREMKIQSDVECDYASLGLYIM